MSIQYTEKSANYSPTTTANSIVKTPFGIEDILFINNNNSSHQNANKNTLMSDKSCAKSSVKNSETEEFKKILSSERWANNDKQWQISKRDKNLIFLA